MGGAMAVVRVVSASSMTSMTIRGTAMPAAIVTTPAKSES